jgi:hypothetical protein
MAALVPVMKDARGEAENPISSATSCGSPTRPSTVVTARSSNTSGSPALVCTGPDEMELTRMPAGQYSAAGASQRGQCCLGGAVGGIIGLTDDARPAGEVDDHALTTAHHFRAQRRHQQIRGFDVRGKQLIQRVTGSLSDGPNQANPALLTRMSTSPTAPASRNASAGSLRSAPTNQAEPLLFRSP